MTPAEAAALKAGDSLDRAVAEHIFSQVACPDWHYVMMGPSSGWMRNQPHAEHDCYPDQCPVQYSQLWATAGLVVEKMQQLGWSFDAGKPINGPWQAVFTGDDLQEGANAETFPEAVSRAALAAVSKAES